MRDFVYIDEGNFCFLVKGLIYSLRCLISNSQSQTFSFGTDMDGSISYEGSQIFRALTVYITDELKFVVTISFCLVLYAE